MVSSSQDDPAEVQLDRAEQPERDDAPARQSTAESNGWGTLAMMFQSVQAFLGAKPVEGEATDNAQGTSMLSPCVDTPMENDGPQQRMCT